jgi:hypothetical protein
VAAARTPFAAPTPCDAKPDRATVATTWEQMLGGKATTTATKPHGEGAGAESGQRRV